MDHDEARNAIRNEEITEVVVTPAQDANGWVLVFTTRTGDRVVYTGHTGTEKVYHSLDQVTEVARALGCPDVRVEETF